MIFKGSRYEDKATYQDLENNLAYLSSIQTTIETTDEDYIYTFKESDRLDILAKEFYGDAQKKWIILFANPQYLTEFDIQVGDPLNIINPDRIGDL